MIDKRLLAMPALFVSLLLPTAVWAAEPSSSHAHAHSYTKHVETHPSQGDVRVIDSARATLVTTKDGAFASIQTSELVPGNTYTLWFVVINRPQACETSPCTGKDVLLRSEATQSDVGYGDGIIAGRDGRGEFSTFRPLGELPQAWVGTGFNDPWASEIHLVINDHGPLIGGRESEMTGTYRGGCTEQSIPKIMPATARADGASGPNACKLVQDVIFVQPQPTMMTQ